MTIKDASKLLSQKLYDPVLDGDDSGRIYTVEMRNGYLNRAIKSLVRIILAIHDKPSNVIKNYYQIVELGEIVNSEENAQISLANYEIPISIYYASEEGIDANKKAKVLSPEDYLPTKNNENVHQQPTVDRRYWTVIDNTIYFLPHNLDYYAITLLTPKNFNDLLSTDTLPFTGLYEDLYILLAAQEGMTDKGNMQKYNLYSQMISDKMKLIQFRAELERKEGKREGDE